MRLITLTTLGLALGLMASSALAEAPNTTRSGGIVTNAKVDESERLDVVRGDIQRQLNDFLSTQRRIISNLNTTVLTWSSQLQNLCTILYQTLNVDGAVFVVPVAVPAPGVVLTPEQTLQFCNSVIAIQSPGGGGNDPDIKPPFTRNAIPPVCDARTQDLAWNGSSWSCVTTLTGQCAQANPANLPRWNAVP